MGGETRELGVGVPALDQDRFIRLQVRDVEPALAGIVGDAVDLALAVGKHQVGLDQVGLIDAAGVAEPKGPSPRGVMDRPPDVDDRRAPLEQGLGLVAHDVAHPLRARRDGLVHVRPAGRRLGAAGGADKTLHRALAQCVVEHDDARGPGHRLDQFGRLRMAER